MARFDPWLDITTAHRDPVDRDRITATCMVRSGHTLESAEVIDGAMLVLTFHLTDGEG